MLSSENISQMLYSFRLLKSSKHASLKFSFALDKLKKKDLKFWQIVGIKLWLLINIIYL